MSTSAVDYFAPGPPPDGSLVGQLLSNLVSSSAPSWTAHPGVLQPNQTFVLDQIDVTLTGASPTQWSCSMSDSYTNAVFFYDSQSIGEGLGIRFVWRGRKPLFFSYGVTVSATLISGSGPANCSCEMRGYWLPFVDNDHIVP